MKSICSAYLAGFDVFRADSVEFGKALKDKASSFGIEAHYPLDNEIEFTADKHNTAKEICFANIDLIKSSNVIIANANSFRGHEPDSGTMFEIGYAVALNKPVFVYMDDLRPMVDKVPNTDGVDNDGFSVEDFNYPINLMIAATAIGIYDSFESALQAVCDHYR